MPVLTLELSTNLLNLPRFSPGAFPLKWWQVPIGKRRWLKLFPKPPWRAYSHTSLAGTSSVFAAARVSAFISGLIQVQIPYVRLVP